MSALELSNYNHSFGFKNKIKRVLWNVTSLFLFRPFASRFFKKWRILVLKCFGAKLAWSAHVYASTKIWAPWNLEMGANTCLGPKVDCYNQGKISIGSNTVISQKSYLCASSHDFNKKEFPLVLKPITIGNRCLGGSGNFYRTWSCNRKKCRYCRKKCCCQKRCKKHHCRRKSRTIH